MGRNNKEIFSFATPWLFWLKYCISDNPWINQNVELIAGLLSFVASVLQLNWKRCSPCRGSLPSDALSVSPPGRASVCELRAHLADKAEPLLRGAECNQGYYAARRPMNDSRTS